MLNKISITKIYLSTAIAILVVAVLLHIFNPVKIDIAVHDTYFVIDQIFFFYIYILVFLISAGLSFLFHKLKRPLLKSLFWIHYLCTIPGAILIAMEKETNTPTPTHYYDNTVYNEFDKASNELDVNFWITGIFLLTLIGLLLFLLNVMIALIKRKSLE